MELDFESSKLNAASAEGLSGLFAALAAKAREGGNPAQEEFLLNLSHVMARSAEESRAAGDDSQLQTPSKEPLAIAVNLTGRPSKALQAVATTLQRSAESWHTDSKHRNDPEHKLWIDHTVDLLQQLAKFVAAVGVAQEQAGDQN